MIRLVPMTPAEFDRYLQPAILGYAEAHLKAGDCDAEEALALSKAEYERLLPLGLDTPEQHLFSIWTDGADAAIGLLWFETRETRGRKSVYIYDFAIASEWRGKGHGASALKELERLVAPQGVTRISLNVMGWNHGAKALYERCGFSVTGMGMTKALA